MIRRFPVVLAGMLSFGVMIGMAGCTGASSGASATAAASAAQAVSSAVPSGSPSASAPPSSADPAGCPLPQSGFDCDFQKRIAAADAYAKTRPGTVGIVLRDRKTGAVWRNGNAGTLIWTESTIKLAMTVNLFLRDRAGQISLSADDRSLIQKMLHSSDDDAADTLWFKYAGADHMAFNNAFPTYGMTSLQPERGFTKFFPYWGFQKCTADDLDRLINYVLDKLPGDTRDYIVNQLQNVDPDQQWGVWGAGPAAQPGNKDGWGPEDNGWNMNTVGFVGPNQRYTLVVMNELLGHGGYNEGQATDSHISSLLFTGRDLS
ncbi:MAG TPA: tat pathway signal sequence [Pseudonocardiaceae bacterium]|nr:tat pathway signal sequence [Pseudonocardiaceae bacterium]